MKKLLLFFIITLLPVLGNAQTLIDGIYYNLNSSDNTASVTNNSNGYYSGRIIIPEKVIFGGATYSVTSIGNNAFKNCANLTNVSISNSVTSIGNGAFGMTSLRTLIVGAGVQQFDKSAFSGAAQPIKTIWFTNTPPQNYSVAQGKINYVANSQYGSLNNKIEYKYLSSMFDVDGITYVPVSPLERTCDAIDCIFDESISFVNIDENVSYQGINMKVLSVQPYTFYQNNSLQKINLDIEGSIGKHAFDGCANLQTVELGNNISIIDEYTFNKCTRLESIIVPDSVKEIHQYAFSGCSNLNSAVIGNGVHSIEEYAFSECTKLASAIIGIGTKTIGQYAFAGCSNLVSVSIGNSLRLIEPYAFSGCSSLFNIIIPGSTHYIADHAFEGCTGLQKVIVDNHTSSEETTTFGDRYLRNVDSETILTAFVSEGDELSFDYSVSLEAKVYIETPSRDYIITNANGTYNYTFTNPCIFKLRVDGHHGNTHISTFINIRNIKIKDSQILALGSSKANSLFADSPLDSIYIGRNICYGLSPFYNNNSLRTVVVNINKISTSEFYGCANLKNVQIGDGVTSIGDWAFSGCSSLKSFSFGTNVSNIGKEAFSDCTALTQLISHATTPPTCGSQALDDINKWTCKLFVPKGCIGAYQAADQWKEFFFIEEGEKPKEEIAINEENFPDENFRAYLVSQSYGKDGIITEEEIKNVVIINVFGKEITNLKGVEYFTALRELFCYQNQLTSLDVSKNTALTSLNCSFNQLTSLDVSKNTALTSLLCVGNQLTSLDVSKNTALTYLECNYNQLTSLDVSKNTALTDLWCYNNKIKGEAMDALVGSLPNQIDATLRVIDLSNSSEENVCTTIQVNVAKEKGWKVLKSNGAEYKGSDPSENEDDIIINDVNFPDENFRAFLKEQPYGEDGIITEKEIKNVVKIDVIRRNITNLKGIEYFTALTELWCSYNQLTSLDVSGCTALKELWCNDNQLTGLDVSKCTALTWLECSSNQLTSLDVSKNSVLTTLGCYNNQLTSLDVSKNSVLTTLGCYNNQLTSLDVSGCTVLTQLWCNDNQLTSLNVSGCTSFTWLGCYNNKIKGEAMDALVGSLPNCEYALLYIIDLSNSSEENVCTSIQVNTAKEKGWRVLTSGGEDYEGCGPVVVQGDVNNDGLVDAKDIADFANHTLGMPTSTGKFDEKAADMNKDGVVNIADIVQIVNNIMGK